MENKTINFKKRSSLYEDEPPEKRLVSDADLYIKKLSENQRNTQTSLQKELLKGKQFYKATEFLSLTEYSAGASTLQEFNSITKHSEQVEKLKSYGLDDDDISLYLNRRKGSELVKHRKVNSDVTDQRLKDIDEIISEHQKTTLNQPTNNFSRLDTELISSAKPQSVETKLLKFALENERNKTAERLPHPMDEIKSIETKLNEDLSPVDVKKIRKKARSLNNQIKEIEWREIPPQTPKLKAKDNPLRPNHSKWDLKEVESHQSKEVSKIFTCKKEPNWYTIRKGEIVKIKPPSKTNNLIIPEEDVHNHSNLIKLNEEDIRKLPKFNNYEPGSPSKVLYLKNLPKNSTKEDLSQVFGNFQLKNEVISINVMSKGKLRGQAFINFTTVETAQMALDQFNGTILKDKPIVIQFGKGKPD